MRTFAKIIGYGLVVLLLAAAVGLTYKYTNGFNEDFKTFYIEYNGKQILTTENKMTFKKEAVHRFDVKYTFDKDDAEPKGYKVKIVSNLTRDFDYSVDGEKYLFSKVGELTPAFEPIMHDTFFELYLPENLSFSEILKKVHNGHSVSIPSDALTNNPYPFRLQVSSYNDKVTYNIDFTIDAMDVGQTSGGNTYYPTNPTPPNNPAVPDEPQKQSYAIGWRVAGNDDNKVIVDVYCPEKAVAGGKVNFSVSLLSDYKCSVKQAEVFSGGKHYAFAEKSDYNGYTAAEVTTYSFTMPEGSVEIIVTIETIAISEYRSISYDTLGSGSNDLINFYCAEAAKPGDYVMVSISLTFDAYDLEITRIVLTDADTGEEFLELEQFNEFFDFTMPDCDVVIMIYLMPV